MSLRENNAGLLISGRIGSFTVEGDLCEMIATMAWDGYEYSQVALGSGNLLGTQVFGFHGKTYGSGLFSASDVGFHVRTEEGVWDTVPGGFEGVATDHCIHNDVVYISGPLLSAGGQPCALVCSFDGEELVPLYHHSSLESDYAYSVTFYQDTLFVSGNYGAESSELLAQGYGRVSKIVDGEMLKVGQGFSYPSAAKALQAMNGKLYMGGWFTPLGSNQAYSMMYYENGQVYTLPSYPNNGVTAMKYYNGGLYVAGDFTQIGNMSCNGVARYDGENWTCLCNQTMYSYSDGSCQLCVRDIEIWNDTLYIGGSFERLGNDTLKRIAKLDMALSEAFPVSVTEQQRQELKLNVYPNPAKHELNITLPIGANAKDFIAIYDMHGRLIQEQVAGKYGGSVRVDVSGLSQGMYVLKYSSKNVVLVEQFVRE